MTSRSEPAARADALTPARLFRPLAGKRGLILAVSGRADSTALMVLVARWRKRPAVLVVSVDHGLRPEAAAEARIVADNAARLGFPWRIMTAAKRPPGGNLQDWARRVALSPSRRRCPGGRLRHHRHGSPRGRSGRDLPPAPRTRLRCLRTCGHGGRGRLRRCLYRPAASLRAAREAPRNRRSKRSCDRRRPEQFRSPLRPRRACAPPCRTSPRSG